MNRIEGTATYFQARAREATERAHEARSAGVRKEWLDIARHWEELAQNADRLDCLSPRQ